MTDSLVHCQLCGTGTGTGTGAGNGSVDAQLLGWVMDREDGRTRWTCPDCAASNIRAMEAKLAPEWW